MSLQISSVGSTQYSEVPCTTTMALIEAMANQLIASGWTKSATYPGTCGLTVSILPEEGYGIQVGGGAWYTGGVYLSWKTPDHYVGYPDILLGSTLAECAANLAVALSSTGIVTASILGTDATSMTVTTVATGTADGTLIRISVAAGVVVFNTLSTRGLNPGQYNEYYIAGAGYLLTSGVTPQGLQMALFLENAGEFVRARVASPLLDYVSKDLYVSGAISTNLNGVSGFAYISTYANTGRVLEFISNAYQCFLWLLDDYTTGGARMACGVPYIREFNAPLFVSGATNTSPVVIETTAAHGRITGDYVFVADIKGNTGANGYYQCTVVDPTHISLDGSEGDGAYTRGGLLAGASTQIARAIWLMGEQTAQPFRTSFGARAIQFSVVTNASVMNNPIVSLKNSVTFYNGGIVAAFGSVPSAIDPVICWQPQDADGAIFEIGQLWDCFLTQENTPLDRVAPDFLGFPWMQFTASGYAMWLKRG